MIRRRDTPPRVNEPRVGPWVILIPAHNEAAIIGQTLHSLRSATPPPNHILVIADHCTDATAAIAQSAGARVFERREGEGGKGAALAWLLAQNPPELAAAAYVAVFDADTTVQPDFFAHLRRALESGPDAAQCFVQPVGYEASPAATLAAYSEVLSQVVDDRLRARLGWPVPLRGTGMVIRTESFRRLQPQLRTQTEDVELSLLLLERRARVMFVPKAVLYDPKPPDAARVSRQRARWLRGLAAVWRQHWPLILRLCLRGPAAWSLLSAVLLKPKTLFVALKALALVFVLILPLDVLWRIAAATLLAADALYYGLGLLLIPAGDRRRYARALLLSPIYFGVWAGSLITALRHRGGWLSVRH